MKTRRPTSLLARAASAFTLAEMMIAGGLFSLVIVGVVAAQLGSVRFAAYVQPKMQSSKYCREALGPLLDEIRSANYVKLGTGSLTGFTASADGKSLIGNALEIFPGTNTAQYILYYHDYSLNALCRRGLNDTNATIYANYVTNHYLFDFEDFSGNVLTNGEDNAVLGIVLQMNRPSSVSGFADIYQVATKVTRRNIL
ncbi:MAG TPA: hypothetical protein VHH88_04065 [Verrucomicrobiae bacterium]|nr:hypothetical protein [Verrucomicrobiae bacterium]